MTTPQRSRTMAAVKSRDTGPELRVASLLEDLGVAFRRDVADLPGRPDFVIDSAPTPIRPKLF